LAVVLTDARSAAKLARVSLAVVLAHAPLGFLSLGHLTPLVLFLVVGLFLFLLVLFLCVTALIFLCFVLGQLVVNLVVLLPFILVLVLSL
jgi:hypothetical protein